jgi:hypothetical protein
VPSSLYDPVRTIVALTLDDRSRIQELIGLLLPHTFGRETLVFEVFDPVPYGHDWFGRVRTPSCLALDLAALRSRSPRRRPVSRPIAQRRPFLRFPAPSMHLRGRLPLRFPGRIGRSNADWPRRT